MDAELKLEFARLHERLDSHDVEFARLHERLDSHDVEFGRLQKRVDSHDVEFARLHERLNSVDEKLDRLVRGVAQQFEAQQQYMDRRFNEVVEVVDFRHGNHERRITRLEDKVFREN